MRSTLVKLSDFKKVFVGDQKAIALNERGAGDPHVMES